MQTSVGATDIITHPAPSLSCRFRDPIVDLCDAQGYLAFSFPSLMTSSYFLIKCRSYEICIIKLQATIASGLLNFSEDLSGHSLVQHCYRGRQPETAEPKRLPYMYDMQETTAIVLRIISMSVSSCTSVSLW